MYYVFNTRMPKYCRMIINLVFLIFLTYILNRRPFNPILKVKLLRYIPDLKYLLMWNKIYGLTHNGQKHFIDKKCFNVNCFLTSNKNLLGDVRYFDGIIFNLQDVSKGKQQFPIKRGYNQKYIFAANDSADNYPVCDPAYEDFFNWTWTYRSDSTVPYRFFTIFNMHHEHLGEGVNWVANMKPMSEVKLKQEHATKSKAGVIFLDKCKSRSKRESFISELSEKLQKYNMTIDVYGKCGQKECRKRTMKPCLWKLRKFYFFYLALEDSFAEDFVTRTVLYAYQNNAVPIVYGKADYNRFLPPNSYLDGLRLGAEKLAEKMHQILFDQKRYLEYFKWKNYYSIQSSEILDVCTLCTALNNPTWLTHTTSYPDLRKWWNPEFESRCKNEEKYDYGVGL